MGLLDKVKNLFTEEVEEPIEKKVVKKEVKKEIKKEEPKEIKKEIFMQEKSVEIAPARKETADIYEKEIEEPKEEKAVLPKYFSDDAFLDLPKKKEENKTSRDILANDILVESYKDKYKPIAKEKKTEKFKPSPIISPVYGVLDKNYKKEDIPSKVINNPYKSDKITVDDVRNKAFGTLEDELENTLSTNIFDSKPDIEDTGIDIFGELEKREEKNKDIEKEDLSRELEKQKQQIEEINEIINSNVSSEKKKVTSRKIDNILEELDEIEELIPNKNKKTKIEDTKKDESADTLEEGDLFNLIDTMYEKGDDE